MNETKIDNNINGSKNIVLKVVYGIFLYIQLIVIIYWEFNIGSLWVVQENFDCSKASFFYDLGLILYKIYTGCLVISFSLFLFSFLRFLKTKNSFTFVLIIFVTQMSIFCFSITGNKSISGGCNMSIPDLPVINSSE